jgi:amidophosphoribosyltransferase
VIYFYFVALRMSFSRQCLRKMFFISSYILNKGLHTHTHTHIDAAGIITANDDRIFLRKDNGLVSEVVTQDTISSLQGQMGIGHVRYPTAGSSSCQEAQPFYTNTPCGICLAHNGNLNNSAELKMQLKMRHSNTNSDSELLMNTLADEIVKHLNSSGSRSVNTEIVFKAVTGLQKRVRGSYAAVVLIHGVGILAFRDPYGIRPLVYGVKNVKEGKNYVVASESVAIDVLGYDICRDVGPGEAILFGLNGTMHSRVCAQGPKLSPCIFEYVYFARPDSIVDGVSVYEARLQMGRQLAKHIQDKYVIFSFSLSLSLSLQT